MTDELLRAVDTREMRKDINLDILQPFSHERLSNPVHIGPIAPRRGLQCPLERRLERERFEGALQICDKAWKKVPSGEAEIAPWLEDTN